METTTFVAATAPQEPSEPQQHRIVAAAQALYLRQGIGPVGRADVAAHAYVPEAAVHHWFPDPAALVHAAILAYTDRMRAEFARHNTRSTTAVAELLALREWMRQEMGQIQLPVFAELEHSYPATWQLWQDHCNGFLINHIRNNLRWGMVQQLYHPGLDVEFLALLWQQQLRAQSNANVLPTPPLDPIEVRQTIIDHFIAGIVTPAGAFVARRLQERPGEYYRNDQE